MSLEPNAAFEEFFKKNRSEIQGELAVLRKKKNGSKKRYLEQFLTQYSNEDATKTDNKTSSKTNDEYDINVASSSQKETDNEFLSCNDSDDTDSSDSEDESDHEYCQVRHDLKSEIVLSEVRELTHMKRVATLLHSRFRNRLEEAISSPPVVPGSVGTSSSGPRPEGSASVVTVDSHQAPEVWYPHLNRRPNTYEESSSDRNERSPSLSSSVAEEDYDLSESDLDIDIFPNDNGFGSPLSNVTVRNNEHAEQRNFEHRQLIQRERPTPRTRQERTIDDVLRNDVLNEVGQLLDARLVTLTLESEFSQTLANHLSNRLTLTGRRRSRTNRNSRTATAEEPNTNRNNSRRRRANDRLHNQHVDRQMEHMQSQLNELRRMMTVSFELQMEMQRTMTQQLAAFTQSTQSKVFVENKPAVYRPSNVGDCLLCADKTVDTVLNSCGHMCCCNICARQLKENNDSCPVCRAPIQGVIRAYVSVIE